MILSIVTKILVFICILSSIYYSYNEDYTKAIYEMTWAILLTLTSL